MNKAFVGDVGDVGGGDVGDVGDVGDAETLSKVLQLIKDNAIISASEIADILKLSRCQCERVIAKLKKRGILEREGNTRTGRWIIRQE